MKRIAFLLLTLFHTVCAGAQTHYLPLSDFKFDGVTAQYKDDTTTVYSLLCTGSPDNRERTDSLITVWLSTRPDATLRPVCSFSYNDLSAHRVTFTYCWVVSDEETEPSLNLFLVRNGCAAANTMLWAKNTTAIKPEINFYIKRNAETKVFVDKKTYKDFVRDLQKAQQQSRMNRNK